METAPDWESRLLCRRQGILSNTHCCSRFVLYSMELNVASRTVLCISLNCMMITSLRDSLIATCSRITLTDHFYLLPDHTLLHHTEPTYTYTTQWSATTTALRSSLTTICWRQVHYQARMISSMVSIQQRSSTTLKIRSLKTGSTSLWYGMAWYSIIYYLSFLNYSTFQWLPRYHQFN